MKKFKLGDKVQKIKGSQWHGTICGTYSTELTPEGYCVESEYEKGSVQIYPAAALKLSLSYIPCGGCGETRPEKRCINCNHLFILSPVK